MNREIVAFGLITEIKIQQDTWSFLTTGSIIIWAHWKGLGAIAKGYIGSAALEL
jgi:hypothetical protein